MSTVHDSHLGGCARQRRCFGSHQFRVLHRSRVRVPVVRSRIRVPVWRWGSGSVGEIEFGIGRVFEDVFYSDLEFAFP